MLLAKGKPLSRSRERELWCADDHTNRFAPRRHHGRAVPWLKRGRPLEWLVGAGGLLAVLGLGADALLAFKWIFVGGPMEESIHLTFAITTAVVSGVMMAMTGFVLKLLLDNLEDGHGL